MCLAVPMRIAEINGNTGVVETAGVKKSVFLSLVDAKVGDYVLVHAGIAIGKVDEKEADETMSLLNELAKDEA